MLEYILKRLFYSVFIIIGIMILTFLLFHVAAGDPSAVLLGKNARPAEAEALRAMIGCDKPLFWGKWKRTEVFSGADFSRERTNFPGIALNNNPQPQTDGLLLSGNSAVTFARNFKADHPVRGEFRCSAPLLIDGKTVHPDKHGMIAFELAKPEQQLIVQAAGSPALLSEVRFFRPTSHFFDSQLLSAMKELVTFHSEFPYVSFFNFGVTLQTKESIRGRLWRGIWPSLMVMLPVFFGELICGLLAAMISCAFRGQLTDRIIMILSVAGMSTSYLVLIIFGQWFFAYYLNLFPVWGWGSPKYLMLPVLLGIISGTGSGVRFYRTVFLDEIRREYLRTARAKGAGPCRIYLKHLLKNALIPVITRASTVLPFLFTGSLLLESFFGIPGLGCEGINALNDSDLQMLKALVITGAFLFIGINLITDIAYAWIDPRIRLDSNKN